MGFHHIDEEVNQFQRESARDDSFVFKLMTFASSEWEKASRRLEKQASSLAEFASIRIWTERELDSAIFNPVRHYLRAENRGFGFFLWKPLIVLDELRSLKDGEFLFYIDSGCHLNKRGRRRFNAYLSALNSSREDVLVFEFRLPALDVLDPGPFSVFEGLNDLAYAKSEVLREFLTLGLTKKDFESASIQGGILLIQKSPKSVKLIEKWAEYARKRPELFDESLDKGGEGAQFIAHRHDQAVLSLLAKKYGVATLSAAETWVPKVSLSPANWDLLCQFPINARGEMTKSRFSKIRDRCVALLVKMRRKFIFS